jgi:hypothetical protein
MLGELRHTNQNCPNGGRCSVLHDSRNSTHSVFESAISRSIEKSLQQGQIVKVQSGGPADHVAFTHPGSSLQPEAQSIALGEPQLVLLGLLRDQSLTSRKRDCAKYSPVDPLEPLRSLANVVSLHVLQRACLHMRLDELQTALRYRLVCLRLFGLSVHLESLLVQDVRPQLTTVVRAVLGPTSRQYVSFLPQVADRQPMTRVGRRRNDADEICLEGLPQRNEHRLVELHTV